MAFFLLYEHVLVAGTKDLLMQMGRVKPDSLHLAWMERGNLPEALTTSHPTMKDFMQGMFRWFELVGGISRFSTAG